ncbi:VOC family protein [Streptomyces sp. NPDC056653]|uniref:VOC family protein n=1 Tax=Streptomyces sp. NPDC056653 TaxID=3345894 RepID=UPI0036B6C155
MAGHQECCIAHIARPRGEADELWAMLGEGGEEGTCGWLKDTSGLSWQVVPKTPTDLLSDLDPVKSERATKSMRGMRQLDIQAVVDTYKE